MAEMGEMRHTDDRTHGQDISTLIPLSGQIACGCVYDDWRVGQQNKTGVENNKNKPSPAHLPHTTHEPD